MSRTMSQGNILQVFTAWINLSHQQITLGRDWAHIDGRRGGSPRRATSLLSAALTSCFVDVVHGCGGAGRA
jgi:hypothetical protein